MFGSLAMLLLMKTPVLKTFVQQTQTHWILVVYSLYVVLLWNLHMNHLINMSGLNVSIMFNLHLLHLQISQGSFGSMLQTNHRLVVENVVLQTDSIKGGLVGGVMIQTDWVTDHSGAEWLHRLQTELICPLGQFDPRWANLTPTPVSGQNCKTCH